MRSWCFLQTSFVSVHIICCNMHVNAVYAVRFVVIHGCYAHTDCV